MIIIIVEIVDIKEQIKWTSMMMTSWTYWRVDKKEMNSNTQIVI